jgi:hypothetical protein
VPCLSETGDVSVAGLDRTSHFFWPFLALVVQAGARRPSRYNGHKSQTA